MKILGFEITKARAIGPSTVQKNASFNSGYVIPLSTVALPYDGQKNFGEMGPAVSYIPDYYGLSLRSWQAYTDSPLSKTVIDKWANWIIDSGLKLKANPAKIVLKSEGVNMTKQESEEFNDVVESRWDVWSNSIHSSYSGNENFNQISKSVYINSKISGDCLVVLRYINDVVKVQYIDGAKVASPKLTNMATDNGNIISNGVEISPTGRVLGYHVKTGKDFNFEFIPAYSSSTGLRTAFLVKGSKWRIDYHRGLPVISTALESLSKIDRYREATVASAEEVANIAYQVVHTNYSDGTSPLAQTLANAFDANGTNLATDSEGNAFANKIAVTTSKTAFNNPKGAEIKTINQSNNVVGFEAFYSTNSNIICSAVGIPPNVAMSVYNDSFSASRAATKDWDHTMDVERVEYENQFYNYVYKFWLYTEILKNKVKATGYLQAVATGNYMIVESYEKARFTGPHFPHIDPMKEVNAVRAKLGGLGKDIPLTSVEQATEDLGCGDSDSNMEQFSDEYQRMKDLDLIKDPVIVPNPSDTPNG